MPGAAAKPLTFDALLESMDDDQRDIIEKHIVGLAGARNGARQLGLVLAQAAIARGQIGVTPRQLLTELGYSDEEITRMIGDAADQPLPASDGKGGGPKATTTFRDIPNDLSE